MVILKKQIDLQMMTSWILKGAGRMKQRDIVKTWTLWAKKGEMQLKQKENFCFFVFLRASFSFKKTTNIFAEPFQSFTRELGTVVQDGWKIELCTENWVEFHC